ncbi:MAG: MmcQ/YjbR family DNA-binding protein [Candidatus Acidiferrales bacterium]
MPVTPKEFRQIVLGLAEIEAKQHMGHPDFRVAGKIFATLGYPDKSSGMVKLTPLEQRMFMDAAPNAFCPCAGAWGRQGATSVKLSAVNKTTLRRAINSAWEFAAPKHLTRANPKLNRRPKRKPSRGKRATSKK